MEQTAQEYVQAKKGELRTLLQSVSQYEQPVEIEARLGVYSSEQTKDNSIIRRFEPGVSSEHFHFIRESLSSDSDYECVETHTFDCIYEVPDIGRVRVTYDKELKQILEKQMKQRQKEVEIQFPLLPYDCRVSLSTESPVDVPIAPNAPWETKREKRRWSFRGRASSWVIDLTQSWKFEPNKSKPSDSVFEIEFELTKDTIQRCKGGSSAMIAATFWTFISHSFLHNRLPKTTEAHSQFEGVSLQKKYYVSEKTDGVRYLLLVHSEGVFLVDRKFDFYLVKDFHPLIPLLAVTGPTLLDGEMVVHFETKRPIFLVFDIVALGGVGLADKTLTERLAAARDNVIQVYRNAVEEGRLPQDFPFPLMMKILLSKDQMQNLITRSMIKHDGHRFFRDKRRFHRTDGVIFTPDTPYEPKTCQTLFKWKFMDEWSVDLKMEVQPDKSLRFSCVGKDNFNIPFPLRLFDNDYLPLIRDAAKVSQKDSVIVEFNYDQAIGYWRYKIIRTDKIRANFVTILFDTLEAIAENIPEQELAYRIPLRPSSDDWVFRLQAELKRLVTNRQSSSAPLQKKPKHS